MPLHDSARLSPSYGNPGTAPGYAQQTTRQDATAAGYAPPAPPRFLSGLPRTVWLLALGAALAHIAPYWLAQRAATAPYEFTGNTMGSPDHMQYRVWMRHALVEGPIVSNRFTTEPHRAYLPVFFYWGVSQAASALGVTPEIVYAYAGSLFAAAFAVLLVAAARVFLPHARAVWWAVLAIMVGGGLGGHLKLLRDAGAARIGLFKRFILDPLQEWPVLEDHRYVYMVKVLVDTHFLLIWLVTLAAIVALYFAIERRTRGRVMAALALTATISLLHVYEGLIVIAITAGVALCSWDDRERRRSALMMLPLLIATVGACLGAYTLLYVRAGLPTPPWVVHIIPISMVAIGYPLALGLMAWGFGAYWRGAGWRGRFLIGWALGCLVFVLASPFNPYSHRGLLSLSIPLYLIAAGIFFSRYATVSARQAVVAVALLAGTPVWWATRVWNSVQRVESSPFSFLTPAHRATIDVLRQRADTGDVLLAEPDELLWLMPEHPGRTYVGHFFMTVDYDRKVHQLAAALEMPERLPSLLERSGARWLFVGQDRHPERFRSVPGLSRASQTRVGWLFERTPRATPAAP